jgi:hypothetical protein
LTQVSFQHSVNKDKEAGEAPMLLQNVSPNTMIQINHSIPYTTVRKQILKSIV